MEINNKRKDMMRKYILSLLFALSLSIANAQYKCPLIPQPNHVELHEGQFIITGRICVNTNNEILDGVEDYLSHSLKQLTNIRANKCSKSPQLSLSLIDNASLGSEGYQLKVEENRIRINASTKHGMLNGVHSFLQLCIFSPQKGNVIQIDCCSIKDSPRYAWRGVMLDESRHFFGTEKVKQLLDQMALHRLNKFHWHLTDAPGWRIEIKRYPKLAKVGGIGNHGNPDSKAKFYTQKEIKEIINYANERGIEIIPEIDMPGHATAANKAYPEFSGGGSEKHPEFTFNPGKEDTYQYLTNILREVAELFPSKYIHLGGDEVHFGNQQWNDKREILKLMKDNKLKDLHEVEQYFIRRMADSVKTMNKHVIGWDEVAESGLDKNNTRVMWWRHDKPELMKNALKNGYEVVLCPRLPLYFDFIQTEKQKYGRTWGGYCDLESVYLFPSEKIDDGNELISGIQACIWTENIQNNKRMDYMTYPRLSAMAEAAWTDDENKSIASFRLRLKKMMEFYEQQGIYYFNVFDEDKNPEPIGIKER